MPTIKKTHENYIFTFIIITFVESIPIAIHTQPQTSIHQQDTESPCFLHWYIDIIFTQNNSINRSNIINLKFIKNGTA